LRPRSVHHDIHNALPSSTAATVIGVTVRAATVRAATVRAATVISAKGDATPPEAWHAAHPCQLEGAARR